MKTNNAARIMFMLALSVCCFPLFAIDSIAFPRILIRDDLAIKTYTGIVTKIDIHAISTLGADLVNYEMDLDGDDITDLKSTSNHFEYRFQKPGSYRVKIMVTDAKNYSDFEYIDIEVYSGSGMQENSNRKELEIAPATKVLVADGFHQGKVILLNHAEESKFWDRALDFYNALKNNYCLSDDDIIFLNENGLDPDSTNPGNIIDGPATKEELLSVFTELSSVLDEDDILLFWSMGHGTGYLPEDYYIPQGRGVLTMKAKIDAAEIGDADDVLESDFVLRSLFTEEYNGVIYINHGMADWVYIAYPPQDPNRFQRIKYVAQYDITLRNGQLASDHDVYIEKLISYPKGDLNENGYIDAGEVADSNHNGILPYHSITGEIDEDDWGEVSIITDNFNDISNHMPGSNYYAPYIIHDNNFDGKLDLDIDPGCEIGNCVENELEADMTDIYNDGFFRGIDLNKDGDYADYISIDEKMNFWDRNDLLDDELRSLMQSLNAGSIVVILHECHSGGFIDDLSEDDRIIAASVIEDQPATSGAFHLSIMEAIGDLSLSDENTDGLISFAEIYNYAVDNLDPDHEKPRGYDDNGDGTGTSERLPSGGDGELGADLSLLSVKYGDFTFLDEYFWASRTYKLRNALLDNVTFGNNSNVVMDYAGSITINSLEVEAGSTLEFNPCHCP